MDNSLKFEIDPQAGMENLKYGLRRALRIEPDRMDKLVEIGTAEREKVRLGVGHEKRGCKPKSI